ncbi:dynamin family protein [Kineosporia babensis]|uniref:Dynamin family protein n=1 Tax=Kineosporia babensis TaxID=499548 RepID=A0A9X1STB0_9ACTN|nr:dynamin family protein [Kineosporia babensis]
MYPGKTLLARPCSGCGRDNPGDSSFCGGCGQRLLPAEPPAQAGEPLLTGLAETAADLEQGRRLAEQHERPDLGRHLADTQNRLAHQMLGVVVVGEYKRGKSSLVNALLGSEICPVDADVATTAPMFVRYGTQAQATGYFRSERADPDNDLNLDQEPVAVEYLPDFIGESKSLHSVEVGLPNELLAGGLCLVDTPGVGGLESSHGAMTMGVLSSACAMIFVTDASQELTAPEMAFLQEALDRVPLAICVVTKTDIYPHWRTIVELDRRHLADAGANVELLPVSSFLRLRHAQTDPAEDESGIGAILNWLRSEVTESAAVQVAAAAQRDLTFVREQLSLALAAEQQVLQEPESTTKLIEELQLNVQRAERLLQSDSRWQQQLSDGMEDLISDVRHDLDERMRDLADRADDMIGQTDPEQNWDTMEAWLHRQIIVAATANHDLLLIRATELSAAVADSFAAQSGTELRLGLKAPSELLRGVHLEPIEAPPGEPVITRAVGLARTAAVVPSVLGPVLLRAPEMALFLGPISLALGAVIGKRVLRDSYERQVHKRREQAREACKRFLDEATFVFGKDCMDSLRRTGRELRNEFRARAEVMHETAHRAIASVEKANSLDPAQRSQRADHLVGARRAVDALNRPQVS